MSQAWGQFVEMLSDFFREIISESLIPWFRAVSADPVAKILLLLLVLAYLVARKQQLTPLAILRDRFRDDLKELERLDTRRSVSATKAQSLTRDDFATFSPRIAWAK